MAQVKRAMERGEFDTPKSNMLKFDGKLTSQYRSLVLSCFQRCNIDPNGFKINQDASWGSYPVARYTSIYDEKSYFEIVFHGGNALCALRYTSDSNNIIVINEEDGFRRHLIKIITELEQNLEKINNPSSEERVSSVNKNVSSPEYHFNSSDEKLSLKADSPDGSDDPIGFHKISTALAEVIVHENTECPLTIGVTAEYGSGKTKILRQIEQKVKTSKSNNIKYFVHFDLSLYHNEKEIRPRLINQFYQAYQESFGWRSPLKFMCRNIGSEWKSWISILILFVLSILSIWWSSTSLLDKGYYAYIVLANLSTILLLRRLFSLWSHPMAISALKGFMRLPNTVDALGERYDQEELLRKLFKASIKNKKEDRVVFVVDNIDRCNPEKVLNVIDELFSLISIDGVKENLVVIAAVDKKALVGAVKERSDHADHYFEKLFNLEINVPKLNLIEISNLLSHLIGEPNGEEPDSEEPNGEEPDSEEPNGEEPDSEEPAKRLQKVPIEVLKIQKEENDHLREALSHLARHSERLTPRKIKRFLTSYRFIKYLAALDPKPFEVEDIIKIMADKTLYGDTDSDYHWIKKQVDMLSISPLLTSVEEEKREYYGSILKKVFDNR